MSALAGVFALAAIGCQATPIPLTVAAGSSMFLPVSTGSFGSELARMSVPNGTPRQDYQRGDLVVVICQTSFGDSACTNAGTTRIYLTTRYVTSVAPDPASPAGIRGYLNGFSASISGTGFPLAGEELAILEIPGNVTPADYYISVRTRPVGSAQGQNESLAFSQPRPIHVAAAAPSGFGFSDPNTAYYSNWANSLPIDVAQDLQDLVPYPTVLVRITTETNVAILPAAANIELGYDSTKVRIKSVYEDRHLGRRSIVQSSDNGIGTLKMAWVDPERCTTGLRIAYDLVNGASTGPVPLTTFTINAANSQAYDLNGSPQTGNPFVVSTTSNAGANKCGPH